MFDNLDDIIHLLYALMLIMVICFIIHLGLGNTADDADTSDCPSNPIIKDAS